MRPKLAVIGAGGFIGSFFVEESIQRGYHTWAGVRGSTARTYLTHPSLSFVELDFDHPDTLLQQLTAIKQEIGRWDYIIYNLGATKCRVGSDFDRINYHYLKQFVECIHQLEMQPTQFIFMSSLGAWGAGDEQDYTPICASDTPRPNTLYGKSKLKAETYLQTESHLPYVIMRPTGVYGPRERDYLLMMKSIKHGIDVVAGFRPQCLTFIYVTDLVRAVFLAIDKGVTERAYFVSDGATYSPHAFRVCIANALHRNYVATIHIPLALLKSVTTLCGSIATMRGKTTTLNNDKYNILKQRNWRCDTSPIQEELGFVPLYSLQQGVDACVAWYKSEGWL